MFAHIYPLTRLPRRFSFFDYRVPEGMNLSVGDLVNVKLKGRDVLGIVKAFSETSEYKRVASVSGRIGELMSPEDVKRIEVIADAIIQSPSNVLQAALQGLRKEHQSLVTQEAPNLSRSIDSAGADQIKKIFGRMDKDRIIAAQLSVEQEAALIQLMRQKAHNQLLVICPRERDAEQLATLIHLGPVATLTGQTKSKQRSAIISAWQRGELQTLIGTRQASLLSAKKLGAIIMTDSGSDDYARLDRNPRFDARNAAELLAQQHDATLIYSSRLPRLEELRFKPLTIESSPTIIDLNRKEEFSGDAFLSESLIDNMKSTLNANKRCLLVFNKKGVASQLECGSCGKIPTCGTCGSIPHVRKDDLVCGSCKTEMWIPEVCPFCQSKRLKQKGIGNERLQTQLAKRFPDARVGVIDKEHPQQSIANVVIVTEFFFKNHWSPFPAQTFGLVADLAIDFGLIDASFRAAEQTAYKLHRLAQIAHQQRAACIIQTWTPEIIQKMIDAATFLKKELELRKTYDLPPAQPLITTIDKNTKKRYKTVSETLKNLPDSTIINVDTPSYEQPSIGEKSE